MTSNPTSRRHRTALVVAATASLFVASCGSSDDAASTDAAVETTGEATADADDAATVDATDGVVETAPVDVSGDPLPTFASTDDDPAVGTPSPVLTGVSFDGTPITLGGPTEQPTFALFLAHWCPHCNDEIPVILDLQEQGLLPEDLDIVGVSTAADEAAPNYPPSQWVVDKGWTYPTMVDSDEVSAMNAVGGSAFPFAVVLDTDGTVLARKAGQASGEDTIAFIEAALATAQA